MLGPPPQISMLKPNPHGGGTWRWGLWEVISHESGALMMGLVSLSKGLQELPPAAVCLRPAAQQRFLNHGRSSDLSMASGS